MGWRSQRRAQSSAVSCLLDRVATEAAPHPLVSKAVVYSKMPELLVESVHHGSRRVCGHRPRAVCLPVVPHRPHRKSLAILAVRVLVILAREARARALVVEAVCVVAPRPAVNRAAPRVQVAERAEERLPHYPPSAPRSPSCPFNLTYQETRLETPQGYFGVEAVRHMFALLAPAYYVAPQFAHVLGWTHQYAMYTQVG